jgi:hypothetical protein
MKNPISKDEGLLTNIKTSYCGGFQNFLWVFKKKGGGVHVCKTVP